MVQNKHKKYAALALLEFGTVASGILASDLMVKRSPIALLRCGTVHPGRFLILVGGSVASTEEAFQVGVQLGDIEHTLTGSVFLGDVHPMLHDAVLGARLALDGEALAVVETRSSPALLAAVVGSAGAQAADVRVAATFQTRPGNPAVTPEGRVFVTMHPLDTPTFAVVEIKSDGTLEPYPTGDWAGPRSERGIGMTAPLGLPGVQI